MIEHHIVDAGLGLNLAIYIALLRHVNNETQQCFPSVKRLALMTGFSESTVSRGLGELEEMKLIHIRSRKAQGRPNLYTMLDTSHIISKVPKDEDIFETDDVSTVLLMPEPTPKHTAPVVTETTRYKPPVGKRLKLVDKPAEEPTPVVTEPISLRPPPSRKRTPTPTLTTSEQVAVIVN